MNIGERVHNLQSIQLEGPVYLTQLIKCTTSVKCFIPFLVDGDGSQFCQCYSRTERMSRITRRGLKQLSYKIFSNMNVTYIQYADDSYLMTSSYRMCTLLMEILRFPIMVAISEPNQEFPSGVCKTIPLRIKKQYPTIHKSHYILFIIFCYKLQQRTVFWIALAITPSHT